MPAWSQVLAEYCPAVSPSAFEADIITMMMMMMVMMMMMMMMMIIIIMGT